MEGVADRRYSRHQERDAAIHLAKALGLPFVDLERYGISCGLLKRVPAELCCRLRCVPLVCNGQRVVLAVDDPFSAMYLAVNPQYLGAPYGRRLEFALTTRRGLDASLRKRVAVVRD